MTQDPYVDPATGVLRNLLGIVTPERLRVAEADLTAVAIADLAVRILPDSYGLEHLCAFHREVFGEIYPWGRVRRTAKENYLRGLSREHFLDRLTHYFAEVNAIHPFREGNGRAQRAFFHQLCRMAGWPPRLDQPGRSVQHRGVDGFATR